MQNIKSLLLPPKSFLINLFAVAVPIALQNMTASLLAVIDMAIIKKLGEAAISSVSLANQFTFISVLIIFGISSGASVFLSRDFGSQNYKGIKETFAITLLITLSVNLFIAIVTFAVPDMAMQIFTSDALLVGGGAVYLRITAPGYLFMAVSASLTALFRSGKCTHYALIASVISLTVKSLLNYALIYGFWIIEPIGVQGAAISTLISRMAEFVICVVLYCFLFNKQCILSKKDVVCIRLTNIINFLKGTYHIILNESFWGLGIASFSIIFGRMGSVSISSLNIAKTLEELFNTFFYGIAIGAVVMLGYDIGNKEYDAAKQNAKRFAVIGAEAGIMIMIAMLCLKGVFVDVFFGNLMPETKITAKTLIAVFAVLMPFRSLSSVLIMGVMRAGGDSKKAMFYDVLPIYLFSFPAGLLSGVVFNLPIHIVMPVMYGKRIIKCIFTVKRLVSGKWLKC